MAKWQSMFSADYINGPELEGKKWTLTIVGVKGAELEDEKGKVSRKAVVTFKEMARGWVLAKTNAICIAGMFGDETAGWIGKRVTIHSEMVRVGKEQALGIRVIGSPDITEPVQVVVKLPRKKPQTMVMRPSGKGQAAPPPPKAPEPSDEPGPGEPEADEAGPDDIQF